MHRVEAWAVRKHGLDKPVSAKEQVVVKKLKHVKKPHKAATAKAKPEPDAPLFLPLCQRAVSCPYDSGNIDLQVPYIKIDAAFYSLMFPQPAAKQCEPEEPVQVLKEIVRDMSLDEAEAAKGQLADREKAKQEKSMAVDFGDADKVIDSMLSATTRPMSLLDANNEKLFRHIMR